jgi:hypothetical protein
MMVLDFVMEADHEMYLAILLSNLGGKPMPEVLRLGHLRPDPGHEVLVYTDRPHPDHLWFCDDLRVWMCTLGCRREGVVMWQLRRRRGTVRTMASSEFYRPVLSNLQVREGPGAWGDLLSQSSPQSKMII